MFGHPSAELGISSSFLSSSLAWFDFMDWVQTPLLFVPLMPPNNHSMTLTDSVSTL